MMHYYPLLSGSCLLRDNWKTLHQVAISLVCRSFSDLLCENKFWKGNEYIGPALNKSDFKNHKSSSVWIGIAQLIIEQVESLPEFKLLVGF